MGSIVMRCLVSDRRFEPRRMSPNAVGFDLRAARPSELDSSYVVSSHTPVKIRTGVCVEIPLGYMGEIRPRSGLSLSGMIVVPGTIDPDYTGELGVIAYTVGGLEWIVEEGDRIAQLVIVAVGIPEIEIVTELDNSWRGDRGFGSTGVK